MNKVFFVDAIRGIASFVDVNAYKVNEDPLPLPANDTESTSSSYTYTSDTGYTSCDSIDSMEDDAFISCEEPSETSIS